MNPLKGLNSSCPSSFSTAATRPSGVPELEYGYVILEDRTDTVFGPGWWNENFQYFVATGNTPSNQRGIWNRGGTDPAYFSNGTSSQAPGEMTYSPSTDAFTYDTEMGDVYTFRRVLDDSGAPDTSDPRFLLTNYVDSRGNETTYEFMNAESSGNPRDDLYKVTRNANDGSGGREDVFAYTTVGSDLRLDTITDYMGRVTNYEYYTTGDFAGFLKYVEEPQVLDHDGTTLIKPKTEYTYTDAGRVETITNPVNDVFTYVYDDNYRVVAEINFDGSVYQYESALGRCAAWCCSQCKRRHLQ